MNEEDYPQIDADSFSAWRPKHARRALGLLSVLIGVNLRLILN